jgi:hypothetical protein
MSRQYLPDGQQLARRTHLGTIVRLAVVVAGFPGPTRAEGLTGYPTLIVA